MAEVLEIHPSQLESMLRGDDPPVVLDVREPWEIELCPIDGAVLIPMRSLPQRLQELPRGRTIDVVCHHGVWSADAGAVRTPRPPPRPRKVPPLAGGCVQREDHLARQRDLRQRRGEERCARA